MDPITASNVMLLRIISILSSGLCVAYGIRSYVSNPRKASHTVALICYIGLQIAKILVAANMGLPGCSGVSIIDALALIEYGLIPPYVLVWYVDMVLTEIHMGNNTARYGAVWFRAFVAVAYVRMLIGAFKLIVGYTA